MSQRTERVDELLRQEIGLLLTRELADPRIGFVTITDVETAPDLRHAKVWVSVIGGGTDRKDALRALQNSMGFVRHELGRTLRIKRIPELHVFLDDSAERGTRVLHLLQELEDGAEPLAIEPFNESLPTPVRRLPHEGDAEEPAPGTPAAPGADPVPTPKPKSGNRPGSRPSTRRGPGGPRAGRGAHPKSQRRGPKTSRG